MGSTAEKTLLLHAWELKWFLLSGGGDMGGGGPGSLRQDFSMGGTVFIARKP